MARPPRRAGHHYMAYFFCPFVRSATNVGQ